MSMIVKSQIAKILDMNIRVFPVALLTVASLGITPMSAQARIVQAVADIDGLTCPFCAFGAEKQLKKVEGVREVKVDVDEGTATLIAKSDQSLDVEKIPRAIKAAGFSPQEMRIVALGNVISKGQELHLQLQEQPNSIALDMSQDEAIAAQLKSALEQNTPLEISGVWNQQDKVLIPNAVKNL